jgi:YebC/PmpR family DNA-binding regulatory protein
MGRWSSIKVGKGAADARRNKIYTKIGREILVAAKAGGANIDGNFQLRTAIEKAKIAGVPNDNIDRAIAKGAGTGGGEADRYEAVRYEGYGPAGVAILVEALTDNRNRTAADLRTAFSKNGGNLGETGCVSWMFQHKGVVTVAAPAKGPLDEDQLLEASMDGGADTYELLDEGADVLTDIGGLENLSKVLKAKGYKVVGAEFRWIPSTSTEVTELDQVKQTIKLIEALEDLDDVQQVTSNFEADDEILDSLR